MRDWSSDVCSSDRSARAVRRVKPAAPGTRSTPPSPGPQLPLTLRYPPDQRLDTFVGAAAGAIEQLQALADGGSDDWLYLAGPGGVGKTHLLLRSEEHTSELQSLMRISYAVFCLKKKHE